MMDDERITIRAKRNHAHYLTDLTPFKCFVKSFTEPNLKYMIMFGQISNFADRVGTFMKKDNTYIMIYSYAKITRNQKSFIPIGCSCPDFKYRGPQASFFDPVRNRHYDIEQGKSANGCKHMNYIKYLKHHKPYLFTLPAGNPA